MGAKKYVGITSQAKILNAHQKWLAGAEGSRDSLKWAYLDGDDLHCIADTYERKQLTSYPQVIHKLSTGEHDGR